MLLKRLFCTSVPQKKATWEEMLAILQIDTKNKWTKRFGWFFLGMLPIYGFMFYYIHAVDSYWDERSLKYEKHETVFGTLIIF